MSAPCGAVIGSSVIARCSLLAGGILSRLSRAGHHARSNRIPSGPCCYCQQCCEVEIWHHWHHWHHWQSCCNSETSTSDPNRLIFHALIPIESNHMPGLLLIVHPATDRHYVTAAFYHFRTRAYQIDKVKRGC
ncbi:hypothetical protein LY76DRAFT_206255 [Colletotrichum caudatum]|nr:hypothetical protein LY76DRAFT_206255 [Colletotrichum caudatum]